MDWLLHTALSWAANNWDLILMTLLTLGGGGGLAVVSKLAGSKRLRQVVQVLEKIPTSNQYIRFAARMEQVDPKVAELLHTLSGPPGESAHPGVIEVQALKPKLLAHEAGRWVGVTEHGGENQGELVSMFQRAVDGKAAGEPWCLAFVQFCIDQVDALGQVLGDGEKSRLYRTEHCLTMWRRSPPELRIDKPEPGCLVIWAHLKDGKRTGAGHVGIVEFTHELDAGIFHTVEGNTGGGPDVEREGDGVFRKQRNIEGTATMEIVGFLRPW